MARTTRLLLTAAVAIGAAHTALSTRDRHHLVLVGALHHKDLLRDASGYSSH